MDNDSSKNSRSSPDLEKPMKADNSSIIAQSFSDETAARFEKTVWWKMDLRIIPIVTMFYLLSWLDRTNFGNARVAGLQKDLGLSPTQYSMALTVTFIPYILIEIPSNLLLKVIGPNYLLPTTMVLWGISTTLQGLVKNYAGLLACRFFLGLFEGGLLPALVTYLSFFYPRRMMQSRISSFFSSASLSGAFSGLLATAISKLDGKGGKAAWSWIFILEGLFTVFFGIFSYFILPGSPETMTFVTEEEREYVLARLRATQAIASKEEDAFSWAEVGRTFTRPHLWFLFVNYFLNGTILFSLGYFTPSIVQSLGFSPIRTQLMSVPPYAVSFFVTVGMSYLSDKYRTRGLVSILCAVWCIIGFAIFTGSTDKWTLYGSLFFMITGVNCSSPALSAWVVNNTSPHVRRATAMAWLSMTVNCGGVLSTWLLGSLSTGPRWTKAMVVLLIFSVLMGTFMTINLFWLMNQNRKKKIIRETTKKEDEPKHLGDASAWYEYYL